MNTTLYLILFTLALNYSSSTFGLPLPQRLHRSLDRRDLSSKCLKLDTYIAEPQTLRETIFLKALQIRGGKRAFYSILKDDVRSILKFSYATLQDLSGLQKSVGDWLLGLPAPVRVCVVINFIAWLCWRFNAAFMKKNFAESRENLSKLRIWTYVTHAFSHYSLLHFFFNMSFLVSIGVPVANKLSDAKFLGVVLGSAVLSGVGMAVTRPIHRILHTMRKTLFFRNTLFVPLPDAINKMTIGFSGVNAALMYLLATYFPNAKLVVFGFSSDTAFPASIALQRLYLIDLLGFLFELLTGISSPIAHGAHLGGYLAGALANRLFKRLRGRTLFSRIF
jgi:membrane associated rhomboid family serine protease